MAFAFVFPGQGSQSVGMLNELAASHAIVKQVFEEASDVISVDLWKLVSEGPEASLNETINTQPAMLAASAAIWKIWINATSQLPQIMAGHSFGGRMCSHAAAEGELACEGLIFCSFPLHPPKKPAVTRARHLPEIDRPMLFLSGTRDDLADAALLEGVVNGLGNARIHSLETANHSYTILKRTRTNPTPVFEEMAQIARGFVDEVI